jgi:hypothetical protein
MAHEDGARGGDWLPCWWTPHWDHRRVPLRRRCVQQLRRVNTSAHRRSAHGEDSGKEAGWFWLAGGSVASSSRESEEGATWGRWAVREEDENDAAQRSHENGHGRLCTGTANTRTKGAESDRRCCAWVAMRKNTRMEMEAAGEGIFFRREKQWA